MLFRSTVHFVARFSRPFASYGTFAGDTQSPGALTASGERCGAWAGFDTSAGGTVEVRVGRADKGRVRIVRGTRAAGDAALEKTELGVVAFESPVAGIDFTANTTLAVNPGDWLYPVVHEPLVPEGLDPELAAKIPGKMALLATYSEENYSPIIDALIEFIDTGVVLAPENCDPAAWIDTNIQCIPADKTGMASFFFPDWIDRVLNALTEKGKVGEWTMGAVGSAVMFVKHP